MVHPSPRSWLRLVQLVFVDAPAAIASGRLDLGDGYQLRGWVARVVGVLLMYSVGVWFVAAPLIAIVGMRVPPNLVIFAFVSVLLSLVVALVLYAACRKVRREDEDLPFDTSGDW